MKFDSELMYSELEQFGESYSLPVYMSLVDMNSFFSSNTKQRPGFAAISDSGSLLVVYHDLLGMLGAKEPVYLSLPLPSLNKLKIGRPLGGYRLKLTFLVEGKKRRYIITLPKKVWNSDFNEQEQNIYSFIDSLKQWNF